MLGPACSLSRKSDNAQGASALSWMASGANCASKDLTLTDRPAQSKMVICPHGQFTSALYFESVSPTNRTRTCCQSDRVLVATILSAYGSGRDVASPCQALRNETSVKHSVFVQGSNADHAVIIFDLSGVDLIHLFAAVLLTDPLG